MYYYCVVSIMYGFCNYVSLRDLSINLIVALKFFIDFVMMLPIHIVWLNSFNKKIN